VAGSAIQANAPAARVEGFRFLWSLTPNGQCENGTALQRFAVVGMTVCPSA
jgi:hypothetical protein